MKRKKKVAVVHCYGGSKILSGIDRLELKGDCTEILKLYPKGIHACSYGCLGGGSCVNACKLHAISFNKNGAAVVSGELCVGCGLCVKACPQQIIRLEPAENTIQSRCSNPSDAKTSREACALSCIGCGICEKNCPAGAAHVVDGYVVIDQEKCIACGMCAVKCPRGVIRDANGIFTSD